jgi:hypothetical protein
MKTTQKGGLSGREGRDKENSQEGRQGFEIAQLIKTLVPTEAIFSSILSVSSSNF